jgi:hypothetical protein
MENVVSLVVATLPETQQVCAGDAKDPAKVLFVIESANDGRSP